MQKLFWLNAEYSGCLKKKWTFRNYHIIIIWISEHYAEPTDA